MAQHEPPIEIQTHDAPEAAIIWLHGLGADGNDFAGIIPALALPKNLRARFIFPHAPLRAVTLNHGYVMRAWYDMAITPAGMLEQNEAHIRESVAAVHALIAHEVARGILTERIVVAGFSQGGVTALSSALHYGSPLAGAIVLSAPVPAVTQVLAHASSANRSLPIFIGHGRYDDIAPIAFGRRMQAGLREGGYATEWHEYPMAHSVCPKEATDIGQFLTRVLSG